MKVILTKDLDNLGRAGALVEVKTGYGRNYPAIELKFTRKVGEQNKLFGSVTSKDIHEQLAGQGYPIERRQVHLPDPLKDLGTFEVDVKLHPEVTAKLKVTVLAES